MNSLLLSNLLGIKMNFSEHTRILLQKHPLLKQAVALLAFFVHTVNSVMPAMSTFPKNPMGLNPSPQPAVRKMMAHLSRLPLS
ncbi:hypothetical protein P692DRAFT_20876339 [Suillus brevipes Sb2]|nr:hypothetical protein P692DRAFT_20876339 [Suillus brevipes Sb2]